MSRVEVDRPRFVEIDYLKAVAILAVVLIHSIRAPWDPRISSVELWLNIVTRFAVPGFLFCSGFLYATRTPIAIGSVLQRLRRVLVPYLICSIAAQIWWFVVWEGHPFDVLLREILLGSSFGPFYYVFVHFCLVLVAPLFVVLPTVVLSGLTLLLIASQGWIESSSELLFPIFWHVRNPLLWWAYFLIGWMIRLHYDSIRDWIIPRRRPLAAVLTLCVFACTGIASLEGRNEWVRAAMWLDIYAILALIFVGGCGGRRTPGPVALLSDATFAIYLLHLFFVYTVELWLKPEVNVFEAHVILAYWGAGIVGSIAVITAARALLGPRSRDVIGA